MNTTTFFGHGLVLCMLVIMGQNSSCGRSPANSNEKTRTQALKGQWGGPDIALEVTSDGINVEFDCANGHIDEPIIPDSEGNFSVKGTYVREHGGAMRSDENVDSSRAVYKGKISGDKMTLTVTFPDGAVDVGPFNLERGKQGRIHKCM
jgi:hypothetical protein